MNRGHSPLNPVHENPMGFSQVFRQLLIIGFLTGLLILSVRSFRAEDFRYGWHMFRYGLAWQVKYYWVYKDGSIKPFKPGKELIGRTREVDGSNSKINFYGIGCVRSIVKGYLRYRYKELSLPPGTVGLRAILEYRINGAQTPHYQIVQFPERLHESIGWTLQNEPVF